MTQNTSCTYDLTDILVSPEKLSSLGAAQQAYIVRQARHAALLGYLEARIDLNGVNNKLADHLRSAKVHADFYDTRMTWETHCVEQVLGDLPGPVVLLKGAAYRALDLGLARGRLASDVDLLLPRPQLAAAEQLLLRAGWAPMKAADYDQHYYREWMHELPPLRHRDRGTVVDLHHSILPPTARFKPDPAKLLSAAIPLPGSRLFTLTPTDTLLHRCAHLFVDGTLHNSLRELVDISGLLAQYQQDPEFNRTLLPRAHELNLHTPLSHALYFCHKLLGWRPPVDWPEQLQRNTRNGSLINFLMEQQLRPGAPDKSTLMRGLSGWMLFMRSHWLRMPPLMLARHLARQAWRRRAVKTGGE